MFKLGDRVKLVKYRNMPEEFGVIVNELDNGCYVVKLDERFCGRDDDGLREVPEDQVKVPG